MSGSSEMRRQLEDSLRQLSEAAPSVAISKTDSLLEIAYRNLRIMLEDEMGPLQNDPELALQAFQKISTLHNASLDLTRKIVDSVVRASHILGNVGLPPAVADLNMIADTPVEQESFGNSVFG